MIEFIILDGIETGAYEIKTTPIYINAKDISYVTTQKIGGHTYTKIMFNCGQFVYVVNSLETVMNMIFEKENK